MPGKWRSDRKI